MGNRIVEIEYRRVYFSKSPDPNTRDTDALEMKKMYFRNGNRVGTDSYREDITDDGCVVNQHRADLVREWIKANFHADPEALMTEDYESHVSDPIHDDIGEDDDQLMTDGGQTTDTPDVLWDIVTERTDGDGWWLEVSCLVSYSEQMDLTMNLSTTCDREPERSDAEVLKAELTQLLAEQGIAEVKIDE
jgi:hypothetical protein